MAEDAAGSAASRDQRAEMRRTIAAYLDAFNRMDLKAVMTFFTPDAFYEPGDGSRHVGRRAVQRALEPQLSHAYGAMVFEEDFFDPATRKAVLRWT